MASARAGDGRQRLATRVPRDVLRRTIEGLSPEAIAESAVPSYCHANPAIRWLFWKRLDTALGLADCRPEDTVLDFGCGSGVALPTLHGLCRRVAATDLDLAPARVLTTTLGLPTELIPAETFRAWAEAQQGRIACILALDVLEHVADEDLEALSERFRGLAGGSGRLVISGPTESLMYQVGRFVAGFHGAYHHRSIFDIDRVIARRWVAEQTLFVPRWPLPRAFRITRYRPRPG